jgi:uncharacterized protein
VAQNRYAKLLAVGEGVELDLEEAAMWRALARRQGLTDPALDNLLVSISPDALQSAEERARFWPSTPPSVETVATVPSVTGPVLPNSTDPENAPEQALELEPGQSEALDEAAEPPPADDATPTDEAQGEPEPAPAAEGQDP